MMKQLVITEDPTSTIYPFIVLDDGRIVAHAETLKQAYEKVARCKQSYLIDLECQHLTMLDKLARFDAKTGDAISFKRIVQRGRIVGKIQALKQQIMHISASVIVTRKRYFKVRSVTRSNVAPLSFCKFLRRLRECDPFYTKLARRAGKEEFMKWGAL